MDPNSKRLDFFVVGAQKAGTTALYHYLRCSPEIQLPANKELHFFDNDDRGWPAGDFNELHRPFDWSRDEDVRGEATPIYLYWPGSLERLSAYNPAAKCIVLLRHPSFRAHSHWRMECARSYETLPFAEAIRAGRTRVGHAHRVFSYVERGYYAEQITRLFAHFPREQVIVIRTDALWQRTEVELARISALLEISPFSIDPGEYRVSANPARTATLHPHARQYLDALYADDIRRTSELAGLDLGDWCSPHYTEPMVPPRGARRPMSALGTRRVARSIGGTV